MSERRLFDKDYPAKEQLPCIMEVEISTRSGRAHMSINSRETGNPLTDNRRTDDGYRYHDVLHIAHATFLGWSPTLRALLGRKRRSDPMVDEVEDGGRAIVIEEGLTAMSFSYAERYQFFEGAPSIQSPTDELVIRVAQSMTQHLEVATRTREDWENAILQGYAIWRQVREQQSGHFTANLTNRTITMHTNDARKTNSKGDR